MFVREHMCEHVALLRLLADGDPPTEVAARAGASLAADATRYADLKDHGEAVARQCFGGEDVDATVGSLRGGFESIYRRIESEAAESLTEDERDLVALAHRDRDAVHYLMRLRVWNPPRATDAAWKEVFDYSGFNGVDCTRLSQLFRDQLVYGFKHRALHLGVLTAKLKALEDPRGKRGHLEIRTFERRPLAGLMHAHFTQPQDIPTNLINELTEDGADAFEAVVRQAWTLNPEDAAKMIAHAATVEAFEARAARTREVNKDEGVLTGEWVVYGDHDGQRFYFCIGRHRDSKVLYQRVLDRCEPRFQDALVALTKGGTLRLDKKRPKKR